MASSELLKQIQAGKRLKKAEVNDRSAPAIDTPKGGRVGTPPSMGAPSLPVGGGPPQLGGLFAGGMPKLKPAGQSNLGTFSTTIPLVHCPRPLHSQTADLRETAFDPKG
ncbi:hypothetical protein NLJ89_g3046 [Agrocybe chaxingu]|uniref:WH2 domain-containing protein n=1 Tax=Agrocybe chaxingu TaxID=84603 RepID=A0A9W8K5N4_9AGAR|nr:hypothetical protein NLJ89_g3046 [Agrocybe chaxingu]